MSHIRMSGAVASLIFAAASFAQPAIFTDLGDHSVVNNSGNAPVAGATTGAITWFKMRLPAVNALSTGGFVDFWTNGPGTWTDTEIGVYNNLGLMMANDDDDGNGFSSALSFGRITNTRPFPAAIAPFAGTDGAAFNGRDGVLAAGDYWIAVGAFNMTFAATGWGVTGTGASGATTFYWNIELALPGTPPSGVGSNVTLAPGSIGPITVTVTPGTVPPSTGITVIADTTAVGGGPGTVMHDDGTGGDVTANDNVFTTIITAPAVEGTYTVSYLVSDAQLRSTPGSLSVRAFTPADWSETGDAGQVFGNAQIPTGTGTLGSIDGNTDNGTDLADMYKISICDFANFTATTNHAVTGVQDTQLFLFDSTGHGVEMDDDAVGGGAGLRSTIGNEFVTANGTYYIAVSHYDVDPANAAALDIWADTPFQAVRAPDGPGASDSVAVSWGGASTGLPGGFNYRIVMTGVCFPSCAADFNGDQVVDFFDYLDFVDAFSANDPSADFNGDQVIDFFDYLDFVDAFSAGC